LTSPRIEELRKKFDENPRRYFAPLANEYRKVGDFDQAIFICQEYLPQQPGHMSGHIVFGQALFEAKRLPEAKSVFETALSLDPENLIALRHLADISRDLGDFPAAKGWYDRVLQADPRNEEVQAIVANLGKEGAAPAPASTAPTAETPKAPATKTFPGAAHAPTVELSAKAVQELLKARQAAKGGGEAKPAEPKAPEPKAPVPPAAEPATVEIPTIDLAEPAPATLDTTPTVEIRPTDVVTAPMEGLEPTNLGGTMDLPTIEPLGLEGNAAPGAHAEPPAAAPTLAPLDGLDTIPLDIDVPPAPGLEPTAVEPTTLEIPAIEIPAPATAPAAPVADDGLLDLGSFGVPATPAAPAAAAPSPMDTPIDGGHDIGGDLIDLDLPSAPTPPAPAPEPATLIMDAVKSVVPVVQDAVEAAAPALMDFVDTTLPAVVETVKSTVEAVAETPTIVMEAIKVPPNAQPPAPPVAPAAASTERPSQSVPFVTETMAQLYLSQGHRAEAIEIYRKLIAARPNDAELKSRLAAIEAEEVSGTPAPRTAEIPAVKPPTQAAAPAPRFTGTGPSIRTVLRELFGLDSSASYASFAVPAPAMPAEVGSIDMLFSADPVATALDPLAAAFDGGFVATRGTIDDVFTGAGTQ
jgi:tetratricopeptide (TPR) repeat protein